MSKFNERIKLSEINNNFNNFDGKEVEVCGWIRNLRDSKKIAFIELNDGSHFKSTQVVLEEGVENYKDIVSLNIGSSIVVYGKVKVTPDAKQPFEIVAEKVEISGKSSPDYPLQNKRHSMEFLREVAHLRPRTNTFLAVFKVRSVIAQAIHEFFHNNGFVYVNTPIITSSDCEGAGEMFRVTTLDDDKPHNPEEDFFGKKTSLTVSGQLSAECMSMAFSNVYTFGPTFRAEDSHTARHAAEFWMVEPEMAFCDLDGDMELAEALIKYIINKVLTECKEEVEFFNKFFDKGLIERLNHIYNSDFVRITYTDAVDLLKEHNNEFEYKVEWGTDLQTEHERYLTEKIFKKPVFVTDYPKEIKAFYMKLNDDNKTVRAVDMLVPGIGEIIGGSQREEDLDKLTNRMNELGLDKNEYSWYLDTRKYGTVIHSGFGLGFERLVMYMTGMSNIRDVIPFPRTPGNCLY